MPPKPDDKNRIKGQRLFYYKKCPLFPENVGGYVKWAIK
jgi:hypothetical protein